MPITTASVPNPAIPTANIRCTRDFESRRKTKIARMKEKMQAAYEINDSKVIFGAFPALIFHQLILTIFVFHIKLQLSITKGDTKMTTISIRLPDDILNDVNRIARDLHVPRTTYLRQAILSMNNKIKEDRRRARVMKISRRVQKESMRVNAEFGEVEHDPGY